MCFFLIVVSDFLGGMLDYGVFYVYSLSSTLSWLFLGYLYWLNERSVLALSSHSKNYDFMYYNLSRIDYQRNANEPFEALTLSLIDSAIAKDVYALRIDVCLLFNHKKSHFVYDAFFKTFTSEETALKASQEMMVLELYEMVSCEIAQLVSDGNGVMNLPKANLQLIENKG